MPDIVCLISQTTGKMIRALKGEEDIQTGELYVIESELGGDLAKSVEVSSGLCCVRKAALGAVKIVRRASDEDVRKFEWLWEKERRAFEFCAERIASRNLPMKLVAVRYFFNEKKGIFFYTADGRIDFRQLVKDLAKELKMRIEMRQIGVRDEAKLLGGIGCCGLPLCCSTWIQKFYPVSIKTAKRQCLNLNPSRLSGVCGRLMCCLMYERDTGASAPSPAVEEISDDSAEAFQADEVVPES
jgi:cell fate regulator YaaT (PSP1 superfamily)